MTTSIEFPKIYFFVYILMSWFYFDTQMKKDILNKSLK